MYQTILTVLLVLFWCAPSNAIQQLPSQSIETCQVDAPYGFPQSSKSGVAICRHAYITYVDPVAKIPEWVVYTLTPVHAIGCIPRSNAFAADQSVPQITATPQDYAGTGYDKGHISPDSDNSFDQQAESESFLMTNMTPQLPGLNRQTWKYLESSIRDWVLQLNVPFTIYAGPIYGATDKRIGSGVVVPHAFYKIVINRSTGQTAGWVFPQAENLGSDLTKFRASIMQIEQLTGINFPFPQNATELAQNQMWPVDFGFFIAAKKAKCGANADD